MGITTFRLKDLMQLIAAGKAERFYDWPEWESVREIVFRMDHFECQRCKARGRYRKAVLVHHVQHLKNRPDLALSIWDGDQRQLVSLCRPCHEEVHPERRWRKITKREYITQERWD